MKINLDPIYGFSYNQEYNHNFCFALINEDNRVLLTPFECKDYMQDLFWSQYTGEDGDLYGIHTTKGMFDINQKTFRLAIFGGEEINLRNRIKMLTKFLNIFEDAQGIERSTITETEDDDTIVIEFSKKWTENGPLLSSFTSLIRISGAYEGEDIKEYLAKLYNIRIKNGAVSPDYMFPEVNRLKTIYKRLLALLKGMKVVHSWDKIRDLMEAHNTGIVGFKDYPEVEI